MNAKFIYDSIIDTCEVALPGAGHDLAKKISVLVLIALLPPKQKIVYDALTDEYQSTTHISGLTKYDIVDAGWALRHLEKTYALVQSKRLGDIKLWKKTPL